MPRLPQSWLSLVAERLDLLGRQSDPEIATGCPKAVLGALGRGPVERGRRSFRTKPHCLNGLYRVKAEADTQWKADRLILADRGVEIVERIKAFF